MTVYAHIENNSITGVYDILPANWRNISNFSALKNDPEFLHSLGWRTIVRDNPTYDPVTQKLGNPTHAIIGDDVVETIEILYKPVQPTVEVVQVELTEEQILEQQLTRHNSVMAELRDIRDRLLLETDFTQLTDVIRINGPELTLAYDTYRQSLRDLPAQYESQMLSDIIQVVFPTKPEGL